MKSQKAINDLGLKALTGAAPEEYLGVYVGDLLSRAMSHLTEGQLWITIMSNVNVIAVASLTEAAAVILAEGVQLTEEVRAVAEEKGVAVFSSELSAYQLCCKLAKEED